MYFPFTFSGRKVISNKYKPVALYAFSQYDFQWMQCKVFNLMLWIGKENHKVLSFVVMITLIVWSKDVQTDSPILSGLQSKLLTGCVEMVTFCRRSTVPATPISTPSESFLDLDDGYELDERKTIQWDHKKWNLKCKIYKLSNDLI